MADVIVTGEEDESPADESAHAAAVAEGASAVHAGTAQDAAEEAKANAEAALSAAQMNIEQTVSAAESADRAEAAASSSEQLLSAIHEAVTAQQSTMEAFMQEIRASREKPKAPKPEPVKRSQDEAPAPKKRRGGMLFKGV